MRTNLFQLGVIYPPQAPQGYLGPRHTRLDNAMIGCMPETRCVGTLPWYNMVLAAKARLPEGRRTVRGGTFATADVATPLTPSAMIHTTVCTGAPSSATGGCKYVSTRCMESEHAVMGVPGRKGYLGRAGADVTR